MGIARAPLGANWEVSADGRIWRGDTFLRHSSAVPVVRVVVIAFGGKWSILKKCVAHGQRLRAGGGAW